MLTQSQKTEIIFGRPFCVITMNGECKYIVLKHIRIKDIPTAVTNKTDYQTIIDLCTQSGTYSSLFSVIHPNSLNELYLSCLDLNKNGVFKTEKKLSKIQQQIKTEINKKKQKHTHNYTLADLITDTVVITGFSIPKILDMSLEELQIIMDSKIRMDTITGENLSRRTCQTIVRMLGVKTDKIYKEYERNIRTALNTGLELETNNNLTEIFPLFGNKK